MPCARVSAACWKARGLARLARLGAASTDDTSPCMCKARHPRHMAGQTPPPSAQAKPPRTRAGMQRPVHCKTRAGKQWNRPAGTALCVTAMPVSAPPPHPSALMKHAHLNPACWTLDLTGSVCSSESSWSNPSPTQPSYASVASMCACHAWEYGAARGNQASRDALCGWLALQ